MGRPSARLRRSPLFCMLALAVFFAPPLLAQPTPDRAGVAALKGQRAMEGEPVNATAAQEAKSNLQVAPSLNLSEPVTAEQPPAAEQPAEGEVDVEASRWVDMMGDPANVVLLGAAVPPRTATRLSWSPRVSFGGIAAPTPVLVVNGSAPGKTLCLTAAIHGDELNGIEIVRRVMYSIDPEKLTGTVIGVPIVNLQGFQRASRYLPDRRDLNRYFPGNASGSLASRIANSFFTNVVALCDTLVDLHTASFHRTNLPQVRADMRNDAVIEFSEYFDQMVIVHSSGARGTLRRAAVEHGIPAVTLEAGEPMRLQESVVQTGVKNIMTLLDRMGMYDQMFVWGKPQPVYYKSRWVRAPEGGLLLSEVRPGAQVEEGALLGTITDPITNHRVEILSPFNGRVIGMAVNQVVMPGFAAFHIGIQASEQAVVEEAAEAEGSDPNDDDPAEAGLDATEPETEDMPEDLPPE